MLAAQLQSFMDALLARDPAGTAASQHIQGGTFSAAERLGIYRNNLRENFIKLMEIEYPVIRRLVGDEFFRQTAREYLLEHPSRNGDLFHAGRAFPQYLEQQFASSDHPYLPDVAALEWAYQEAMVAPDSDEVFDVAGLARIAERDYGQLLLRPHPALRLVRSRFPIVAIWLSNQPEAGGDDLIDLQRGGEHALLLRPLRSTSLAAISSGAAEFLQSVLAGKPLQSALDGALREEPGFDLQTALATWIQGRTLVGWSTGAAA